MMIQQLNRRLYRWSLTLSVLILLLSAAIAAAPGYAQDQPQPLVLFVVDDDLETASVIDPGPDGLTRLDEIFRDLGAQTSYIRLNEPIPDKADLVVIVRPWQSISSAYLGRLWVYMSHGGNVLLAIDPVGHVGSKTDDEQSGLVQIIETDFGVRLQDTFIFQPWFTRQSITTQRTSFSWTYPPETALNPVVEPLVTYELPVQVWGARSLTVDPIGPGSQASPLLYSRSGYAESNKDVFEQGDAAAPFEINLGEDFLGNLPVAAIAENTGLGSRIAVLGDSEIVQNDFGLALAPNSQIPIHVGNYILVERLAAWLLELPAEAWPSLPSGYNWLAVDGSPQDWSDSVPTDDDPSGDTADRYYDIEQVRVFRDDNFLYVTIRTTEPPPPAARLTLSFMASGDAEATNVFATTEGTMINGSPVVDARMALGEVLEFKLPLRIISDDSMISQICLSDSAADTSAEPSDCLDQSIDAIPEIDAMAPNDSQFPPGPLVSVFTTSAGGYVNLRTKPDTLSDTLVQIPHGKVLTAIGRDETGEWILVQTARYTGWLASFLILPGGDLTALPVVTPAE